MLPINTRVACVIYTLGQVVVMLRPTTTVIMFHMSTKVSSICLDGNSTNPVTAPEDILKINILKINISAEYKSVRIRAKALSVVATLPINRRVDHVDYTVGHVVVVTRPTTKIILVCMSTKLSAICLDGNSTNLVTAPKDILKINSCIISAEYKSVPIGAKAPRVVATSPINRRVSRVF